MNTPDVTNLTMSPTDLADESADESRLERLVVRSVRVAVLVWCSPALLLVFAVATVGAIICRAVAALEAVIARPSGQPVAAAAGAAPATTAHRPAPYTLAARAAARGPR